ncbi:MAG: hypothetical protein RL326_2261 [Pseudomonadota bacterium]
MVKAAQEAGYNIEVASESSHSRKTQLMRELGATLCGVARELVLRCDRGEIQTTPAFIAVTVDDY